MPQQQQVTLLRAAAETWFGAEEHVGQETSPYTAERAPQLIYLSCTQNHTPFFIPAAYSSMSHLENWKQVNCSGVSSPQSTFPHLHLLLVQHPRLSSCGGWMSLQWPHTHRQQVLVTSLGRTSTSAALQLPAGKQNPLRAHSFLVKQENIRGRSPSNPPKVQMIKPPKG